MLTVGCIFNEGWVVREELQRLFEHHADIKLAMLFGSVARDQARPDSDLDVAVAADRPLSAERRLALIEALAAMSGRPIDLIDMRVAGYPIMTEALTKGEVIVCKDRNVYADMIKRMWYERADFGPIRERILAERRGAWIDKS